MNGKKVVMIFGVVTVISAVLLGLWIKQGYETRPKNIVIEEPKK